VKQSLLLNRNRSISFEKTNEKQIRMYFRFYQQIKKRSLQSPRGPSRAIEGGEGISKKEDVARSLHLALAAEYRRGNMGSRHKTKYLLKFVIFNQLFKNGSILRLNIEWFIYSIYLSRKVRRQFFKMTSLSKYRLLLLVFVVFFKPDDLIAIGENYDELGFKKNKTYLKFSPEEYVNIFSGNLLLTHTDMILPGNGGLDLEIQRTYNSKLFADFTNIDNPTISGLTLGSLGVGWDMHFGRISDYGLTVVNDPNEFFLQMPDGSIHPIYNNDHANINSHVNSTYITEEFWKIDYDQGNDRYIMTLTDGAEYTFGRRVTNGFSYSFLYVTSIRDMNGNDITIEYYDCCNMTNNDPDTGIIGTCPDTNLASKTRHIKGVTDSVGREIDFSMLNSSCRGNAISSIDANGNIYNYLYFPGDDSPSTTWLHWDGGSGRLLMEVQPPIGPSWQYFYDVDQNDSEPDGELISVTYPSGGVAQYDYETVVFDLLNFLSVTSPVQFRMITSRTTSGPNITSGTWMFDYDPINTQDITTVTDSCGNKEVYEFFGLRAGSFNGGWSIGLLNNKEVRDSVNSLFQTVNSMWTPYQISNDGIDPISSTIGIFLPLLSSETIFRGGVNYVTNFSYNTFYGSPTQIAETGEISRTTDITYFEDLTAGNYIIGKPLITTITVDTESKTIANAYDINGNLLSEDNFGVITDFSYYPDGNLEWQRNAIGFYTHFDQYSFGLAGRIRLGSSDDLASDPTIIESRTIDWEGTISSFTNGRGHTTSYGYDNLNRLTSISPPPSGEAQTTIEYDNLSAQGITIRKADSFVQHFLDGFGRPIGALSTTGGQTQIDYDACGRKVYESLAFNSITPNVGESFTYDPLGRIRSITHPDNTRIDLSYSGNSVTITNERNINTTLNYNSFGDPDEKRLSSILDSHDNMTSYEYDLLGNIKRVDSPLGSDRVFTYNSKNFLISESHPESGTTTLDHDEIGNVTSKTNADGKSIGFQYDPLNRLTLIDHLTGEDDVIFDFDDASNRILMESGSAGYSYAFQYDQSNRLTKQDVNIGGINYSVDFIYDEKNNPIQSIYPSGEVVNYDYDADNRILHIPPVAGNFSYHPSGAPVHFDNEIGVSSDFTYDNRSRLKTLQASRTFPYLLVNKEGLGGGAVMSNPLGIDCGTDCALVSGAEGTEVTLTATPDQDSNFVSWGGDPDCADGMVTMIGTKVCIATFALKVTQGALTVSKDGSGTGTVTSSPTGIDCGSDCAENYDVNAQVTLTATPDAGSSFSGWSGDPDCSDGTVTMDTSKTCNATFGLQQFTLNVVNLSDGFGSGTVTSSPAGISCGGDCSEVYDDNTQVTLIPMPDPGSQFGSWSGVADCLDGMVTMDLDKSCGAKFVKFFMLTIQKNGSGSGNVSSLDGLIDCGGDCSEEYGANSIVSFNRIPDPGSTFVGWSGPSGCPTSPTSSALMVSDLACTARFDLITVHTLTVNKTGTGNGTVTSSPAGIDCGADCSENYNDGTAVTLAATPDTGASFTGWSGDADCSDGFVTMDAAKSCTANFTLIIQYPLAVTKDGTGTGTVMSSPGGIDCGADCAENYDENAVITLTATPDAGSIFDGWSGDADCSDGVVTMSASKACNATFSLSTQQFTLTVSKSGTGSGTVTSNPLGIACGSDCTENYMENTVVTLTSTPDVGSVFGGWSGDSDCSDGVVLMDAIKNCTASFDLIPPQQFALTVKLTGSGSGTISSTPAGIDCGADCTENYDENTQVTLTVIADIGSIFTIWTGDADCADGVITLDASKTCIAEILLEDQPNQLFIEVQELPFVPFASVSIDGDLAIVGAPSADISSNPDQGSAFIYERGPNGVWQQVQEITASDGTAGDNFGTTVSISGDWIVVGVAVSDIVTPGQGKQGKAYIFKRDVSGVWNEEQILFADDGKKNDEYGEQAIIRGDKLAVRAHSADVGADIGRGAVYVYEKDPSDKWSQVSKLSSPVPDEIPFDPPDTLFGVDNISFSGDRLLTQYKKGTLLVRAYFDIFERSISGSWSHAFSKLDLSLRQGGIEGDTAIVDGEVFKRLSGSNWAQVQSLGLADAFISGQFALVGSTIYKKQSNGSLSLLQTLDKGGPSDIRGDRMIIEDGSPYIFEFGDVFKLTVTKSGTGTGSVTSTPIGINCNESCLNDTGDYLVGTEVTLTPVAGIVSVFAGWSGDPDCADSVITMDANKVCEAVFDTANLFSLSVSKTGTGDGVIKSTPAAINCGGICAVDIAENTVVTLTFSPNLFGFMTSKIIGWSGDPDCSDGVVTMDTSKSCIAILEKICDCDASFAIVGTNGKDTLRGSRDDDIICGFDGDDTLIGRGGNDCLDGGPGTDNLEGGGGTDTCLNGESLVNCETSQTQHALSVNKTGMGSGIVTSNPTGISCGSDCTENYDEGTSVALTATPDAGSSFVGWSGDCDVNGMVTMDAAKNCSATFTTSSQLFTLTVNLSGAGTGSVTSSPSGIDCGVDCTEDYVLNTQVTLSPTSDAGSTFIGWSGDADCLDGMVTMDASRNCTATFDVQSQDPCDCNDPNAILGTGGNDTLTGTQKSDIICGFGGNDTLIGKGGNDCIFGGAGNDTIRGNNGADNLFGGDDNDAIEGGGGNDLLDGGNGADNLDGGKNTDTCLNGETNTNCEQFSGL
jgi:YD repeat-containing protein